MYAHIHIFRLTFIYCLSFLLASQPVLAQTKDWQASVDAFWNSSENWTPMSVPSITDDVRIIPSPPLSYEFAFIIASGIANSVEINDALLGIEGTLLIDEGLELSTTNSAGPAQIILYFNNSKLEVGINSSSLPALDLNGGSNLELRRGASNPFVVDPPAVFISRGMVDVDNDSSIQGTGVIELFGANSGLNLNGTLEAMTFGSIDDLLTIGHTGSTNFDLDGSNETGRIIVRENSNLFILGSITDPFSGDITLEADSTIDFSSPSTISIDGSLSAEALPGPMPTTIPITVNANALNFEEGSLIDLLGAPSFGELTINTNNLTVKGDIRLVDNDLVVNAVTPWRFEGEVSNQGGQASIKGSPLVMGSGGSTSSNALLNAIEHIIIESPITLESTADVRVIQAAALGRLSFEGFTILQGPDFNGDIGSWPGIVVDTFEISPAAIDFYGDLTVQDSTTVFASIIRLGRSGTPININLDANQHLTLDARNLLNESTTSLLVNNNAIFEMVLSDPMITSWTNNMSISLNNATLRSSNIINNGSIFGTGLIDATVTGSGFISPGLSPGMLKINGHLKLSQPEIKMEIGGPNPGDFDQIAVHGDFFVDGGRLLIEFIDGYRPKVGDSFNIFIGSADQKINFSDIEILGLPRNIQIQTDKLARTGHISFEKKSNNCKKRSKEKHYKYKKCKAEKRPYKDFRKF